MSVIGSNVLAGASGQSAGGGAGGLISRSLRFNSGDDSYLSRQPSSASDRKKWTWAGWVKRSRLGGNQSLFTAAYPANETLLVFDNSNRLVFWNFVSGSYAGQKTSTAVFRDCSAWYHISLVWDSGNSTAADRIKIYVNGTRIDTFSTSQDPAQNTESIVNDVRSHRIGDYSENASYNLDGYLADVHFIDGQALAPTDFGETNTDNLWVPKAFAGTYGPLVDQSQTWSSSTGITDNSGTRSSAYIFDGVITGSHSNGLNTYNSTITLANSVTATSSIRFYGAFENASGVRYTVNGTTTDAQPPEFSGNTAFGWASVTNVSFPVTINNVGLTDSSTTNGGRFVGIEIDGKLLVDSTVSLTDNSFHLDFTDNSSNAALGTDTSGNSNTWTVNNLIANRESVSTDTISNVVTSSLSTVTLSGGFSLRNNAFYGATPPAAGSSASFGPTIGRTNGSMSFSPAITASSKIELWAYADGGVVANSVTINGSATISIPGGSSYAYTKINCNTTSLSSLAFAYPGGATDFYMVGFYVDDVWYGLNSAGTVLTFPTSNNFNGFTVGDVVQQISGATTTLSESDYNIIFGGSSAGNAYNSQSGGFTVDFTNTGFTGNTTIYANISGVGGTFNVYAKDLTTVLYTNSIPNVQYGVTDLGVDFEDIGRIQWTGDYSMSWFKANNVYVNPTLNQSSTASITAIDASGPTINVNAGNWYGSNGSGTSGGSTVLSTTAVTNGDNFVDTPTNGDTASDTGAGGEITGCYATWNPINSNTHSAYYTLSNGNLKCVAVGGSSQSGGSRGFCVSTIGMSSGKYYFELTVDLNDNNDHAVGIAKATGTGYYSTAGNWTYQAGGNKFANSGSGASYGASYTAGDIIGVAFDADTGVLVCYKNGSSQGTLATVTTGETYFFVWGTDSGSAQDYEVSANFGQRAFSHPVSGYKSLNTASLPTPTIADGSKYFDTKLYTGNGSTQSITMPNALMSPDFVWLKRRTPAAHHGLYDAVRGATKQLSSNLSDAESTQSQGLTSFDSNGFSLGNLAGENGTSEPIVSWNWDAGSSNTTIAAGSLNSSAYNQSQTWSGLWTGTAGYGSFASLHDADITNYVQSLNGTLTFSSAIAVTSIRIYANRYGANATLSINGTDVTSQLSAAGSGLQWNTITGFTSVTSIAVTGADYVSNLIGLYAIELSGKLLVDNGVSVPNVPSIASTVRANPSAGFSIVTYSAASNPTIGHGLNAVPEFVIVKCTDVSSHWTIFHKDLGVNKELRFTTAAASTVSGIWGTDSMWTANTFGVYQTINQRDNNYGDMVAYCFSSVESYSSVGSYIGNGSTSEGPFVFTGFKVAFLMVKNASTSGETWTIYDAARDPHNLATNRLQPNTADAETSGTAARDKDLLSNGFKVRGGSGEQNTNGDTYIYLAFASNPFASNGGLAR